MIDKAVQEKQTKLETRRGKQKLFVEKGWRDEKKRNNAQKNSG